MKVEIVSKNDMVETFLVTRELLLILLSAVKISVINVFCFNIENRRVGLFRRNNEIRSTAINSGWLISYNKRRQLLIEQLLKHRSI